MKELERDLKKPFPQSDIQWRVSHSGIKNGKAWAMVLAYVDARAVRDRLDEVFGIDGWQETYKHEPNGVMCTLEILGRPNMAGERVVLFHRQDGSPETAVEAFKGGISKALVRTAASLGIGRYLYNLTDNFAKTSLDKVDGWHRAKDRTSGNFFWWQAPELPAWALPEQKPAMEYFKGQDEAKTKAIELTKELKQKNLKAFDIVTSNYSVTGQNSFDVFNEMELIEYIKDCEAHLEAN